VSNPSGVNVTADVSDVNVSCVTPTYSITGQINGNGLEYAGNNVVVYYNGIDEGTYTIDGLQTFVNGRGSSGI
jgi:hypothetical protein